MISGHHPGNGPGTRGPVSAGPSRIRPWQPADALPTSADHSRQRQKYPELPGHSEYRGIQSCISTRSYLLKRCTPASRPNPIKGELRNKVYELFEVALRNSGIDTCHRDRFIDRGDGILALIHPVDQIPKALLLNRVVPFLNQLLAEYNASLPRHREPQRQLRIRVVMHAGEIHYDANGCFGEALDVAFRLLDAARVKKALREMADPLILVISGDIYTSVVRHGYDGIDYQAFHPLVCVQVAGKRYPGWIRIPQRVTRHKVAQMASYRRPA
jgi:hypothetical protein